MMFVGYSIGGEIQGSLPQTDETTTLDHLAPSTMHAVTGSLTAGPTGQDDTVQISLTHNGFNVPVEGASNNEGHLLRGKDGYPQAFSFTFESPTDVSGLQLRVLSATAGWVVTHTVEAALGVQAEPPTRPTSQGEVPATLPEVYEADASTDTPTEDLAAYQTYEVDWSVDPEGAALYEIGWGTMIATALKAHGPNQASLDWAGGEIFYWHKIRDNASEPLKSVAQENATFWGGMEGRILGGTPVPPWNSETFLSAAYKWGWYTTVMFHRPEGQDIVGIETWNSDKNAYW